MRVANKSIYDSILSDLGKTAKEMIDAHEVVSTGKNINKISDDPVGMVTVLTLRSSLANIDQLDRNIVIGDSWLTSAETGLTGVNDILTEVKHFCTQYASANVSATDRLNAVNMVDGYLRQIISLANSQTGDRYIFSGTNTSTAPFVLNGAETQVDYFGNDTAYAIQIGQGNNLEVGWDGQDIFGETGTADDIFQTLIDLKNHLQNNDVASIQDTLAEVEIHYDKINGVIAELGGKAVTLDIKSKVLLDLNITYTERLSEIEEADITDAIMKLTSKELAYQATLSSASKVMRMTLLDYL